MFVKKTMFREGLSLVELLVTIAIISILVGLMLPAIQMAREAARRASCQNNLRQVGLATLNFEAAREVFPLGGREGGLSCFYDLLPYLEQENLSRQFKSDELFNSTNNLRGISNLIPVLRCPSDSGPEYSNDIAVHSYFSVSQIHGELIDGLNTWQNQFRFKPDLITVLGQKDGKFVSVRAAEIRDGLSNTIMFGEVHRLGEQGRVHDGHVDPYLEMPICSFDPQTVFTLHGVSIEGSWPGPLWGITNGSGGDAEFYSEHAGRLGSFVFADGSVRSLTANDTPVYILVSLLGIDDGH